MTLDESKRGATAYLARVQDLLRRPVDIASMVALRVSFGLVLAWHFVSDILRGHLELQYLRPHFLFQYPGFSWVQPLPDAWMFTLYWALAALSLAVAAGFWYRASCFLLWLGFTYTFLLDQARYQNHLYLTSLLCFLLIFVPTHRRFSLDAVRNPHWRRDFVAGWGLWLLRFQLAVVYFFGGIAKINKDWLIEAQPMRIWLAQTPPGTVRPPFASEAWMAYLVSWGGLAFDLAIVPLLLWKRTRAVAFVGSLLFHLANAQLFNIGYFPWMMAAATTLFFSPDWPRRLRLLPPVQRTASTQPLRPPFLRRAAAACLALYLLVQLVVPLRHWVIPGHVSWTEEGHRFSWRMKLRDKQGRVQLVWIHGNGTTSPLDAGTVLTNYQQRKMLHDPRMVQQLAAAVAEGLQRKGQTDIDIRAHSLISLNGWPPRPIIDPEVNLATQRPGWRPASWITPWTP